MGAASSVAGSFGRGLLPRSAGDQAIVTATTASITYELTATAWSTLAALAALPGQRPGPTATLVVAGLGSAAGTTASLLADPYADRSLVAAGIRAAGRRVSFAALAGGAASSWDLVVHERLGVKRGLDTTLLPAVVAGAGLAALSVARRNLRARRYGLVAPDRPAMAHTTAGGVLQASLVGGATALGLVGLSLGEQLAALGLERGMSRVLRRDAGALGALAAHTITLGTMVATGAALFTRVTARIERRDDVVEPAYPVPPTSEHVTAGPRSAIGFDTIGKEGRRFVRMALTPEDIEAVMGEPAVTPVRVVGGYEAARDLAERARLTLQDLESLGGFERSLIAVGPPTGVGYFNYTVAEALEYLTRGDCAIVVPQYALVPSALALPRTGDAIRLTRLVLEGIQQRVAALPAQRRPRVVLIGESLGANVALDVGAAPGPHVGIPEMDRLGVSGGLYLGVPFRTETWRRWRENPEAIDPDGRLVLVSQPDEAAPLPPAAARHLMVVHHDDPVNKFAYGMVVQRPWWLGPPAERPPLVPRETRFRVVTSFVIALLDLKNGMDSKPGEFVRRGHDYRIEARLGLQRAFGLTADAAQEAAIDRALPEREEAWAATRLVARKFARARSEIERTLTSWGRATAVDVADLDPASLDLSEPLPVRLGSGGGS